MGQNTKCPGYNLGKNQVDKLEYIFNVYSFHHHPPDIETALGDCTMFSVCCIVMRVTLSIPAPETPDNTIHWPNAIVMLGHHLRRWGNIIPTKTL